MAESKPGLTVPEGFIVLGHISRPHGVHGALVLTPYTDNPDLILDGGQLELLSPDGLTRRPVGSLKGKIAAQGLIVKIKTVTSREAAAELKGWRLGLNRADLPATEDDEVYLADLVGLTVFTETGLLGRVTNLMEAGAGPLLVIEAEDGREVLLPFQEEFIVELDVPAGRLVMAPPPGLLDL